MYRILILIAICFQAGVTHSQSKLIPDSLELDSAVTIYRNKLGTNLRLFNGVEDRGYTLSLIGSPYYIADSLSYGSVMYDGVFYSKVLMKYDLVRKSLVVQYPGSPFCIRLLNTKLTSFDLLGRHFIKVTKNEIGNLNEGLYEMAYNDGYKFLIARSATTQNTIEDNKVLLKVATYSRYYFIKDDHAIQIENLKSALKFRDDNGEIKDYLKRAELNFKKDKELILKEIISYKKHIN